MLLIPFPEEIFFSVEVGMQRTVSTNLRQLKFAVCVEFAVDVEGNLIE